MSVSGFFAKEMSATLARLGISQREAARRTGISPGYLSNMCLGKVPGMGKLLQFTGGLHIDPDPLLAAAGYPQASLQPAGGHAAEDYPIHPAYREITDFCLRVVGNSMWPHLQDGDIVGVKAQPVADSGQVVVARLGDEVTVRRLSLQQGVWQLEPFNAEFKPIPVDLGNPDFVILGIVAWHSHDWLADVKNTGKRK